MQFNYICTNSWDFCNKFITFAAMENNGKRIRNIVLSDDFLQYYYTLDE
jgi:hypothetical protein